MPIGVYDPVGKQYSNEAQFFQSQAFDGGAVAVTQSLTLPIRHFGLTIEVDCSVSGRLTVEEFKGPDPTPAEGLPDAGFGPYESDISVVGGAPKKIDFTTTFRPLRMRFVPTGNDPYVLSLHVRQKGGG